MKQHQKQQKIIRLGTHGEDYGSWMSNPVFYMIGGLLTLSAVLAALSFSMFHIAALGILFSVAAAALLALLIWCAWIRKQYAFGGGGMMERVHQVVLSHLDFDGQGQLLEVGCGLRRTEHTGGSHLAGRPNHRHGLLGCGLRLWSGHVREKCRERGASASGVRSGTGMPTSWISLMRVSTPW